MMIVFVLMILTIFFLFMLNARLDTAYFLNTVLLDAMYDYLQDKCDEGLDIPEMKELVWFDDLESLGKTMWRVWDWSYTRMLPKEKLKLIEPYIPEWVRIKYGR